MDRNGRCSSSSSTIRGDSSSKGKEPSNMSYCQYGRPSAAGAPLPPGLLGCFSCPPRSYSCSFCKREFRSAQALGGHMNVHRREKARLRQSPPALASSIHCNPNPNSDHLGGQSACFDHHPILPMSLNCIPPSPASRCTRKGVIFPVACAFPFVLSASKTRLSSSSSSKDDADVMKSRGVLKAICGVKEVIDSSHENNRRSNQLAIKGSEIVSLELDQMGMIEDVEENLDLELRLGYND